MPRTIITADLLTAPGNIGHQVNCRGVMGAGLAKAVRTRYPEAFRAYHEFCQSRPAPELLGMIQPVRLSPDRIIFNLFGQLNYGLGKTHTDYDALRTIAQKLMDRDITIHLPYGMGCGLAGGDWTIVSQIFENVKGDWYQVLNFKTTIKN